jgi:hypothetical protein
METIQRDKILTEKLNDFYNIIDNFNIIYDIYTNPKISLRVIDWFVTNYSKKNNINYYLKKIEKKIKFNVYTSYKSQLKSYSKKYFDPFCRRSRIELEKQGKKILTTIGQLNFFKWAIENNIIEYIMNNYKIIDDDMNKSMSNHIIRKKGVKKRKELSKSSYSGLNFNPNKVVLYFD